MNANDVRKLSNIEQASLLGNMKAGDLCDKDGSVYEGFKGGGSKWVWCL